MTAHEPRTLGYYAASHWFMGAVVLTLIGLLALVLLRALDEIEAEAERQAVELTVRNIRTGMQYAMAEALMRQRAGEVAAWEGSNPVLWLATPPVGYRGECSSIERASLPGGTWCFERASAELAFQPRDVTSMLDVERGVRCKQLAWRVVRVVEHVENAGFIGVRIESASTCRYVEKSAVENVSK